VETAFEAIAMGQHRKTLLINSTGWADRAISAVRKAQEGEVAYDIGSVSELKRVLQNLIFSGHTFDNAVFSTHGNSGVIFFDDEQLAYWQLYKHFFYDVDYSALFPRRNARILFNGCNVADGVDGWKFLVAAARCFLTQISGTAIGWTSKGFQAPFGLRDGHVIHFWGDARAVMVLKGNAFRFYEDWKLIESRGVPQAPSGLNVMFQH